MTVLCRVCRAELLPDARFCGACGAASRDHVRAVAASGRAERRLALRSALSLFATCAGTFAVLQVPSPEDVDGLALEAIEAGSLLLTGLVAAFVGGGLRGTTPVAANLRWLLAAAPLAGLTIGVAFVYLHALGLAGATDAEPMDLAPWIGTVVFAPLVEEWVCRGVAWRAAERLSRPATALVITSVLFAFLHGLGGLWLLELPHRFAGGLAFGFLRWRSGSLWPGVLAHALHNGLVCGWPA